MTDRHIAEQRRTKPSADSVAAASRKRQPLLARSNIGFQEAQRLSHTGSFSWQLSPEEITWSEETYRIYEYSPEITPTMEMARRRVHPDDVALFAETALRAKQEGKDFEFAHRLLMPDGSIKNLRVVARAATDRSGRLAGYFGAVMDVTAQRLAQAALEDALKEVQATRDRFQLAIDAIPGLVWSALPDGHIDFLNRRWREYTGLSLEQAGGWGWRAAIHPEDLPGLESYWRSVLASGKPDEKEARLRRGDGVYRWFLFRAVPLYDEAGTLVKWYGQTTDIDDRKQAEQQVRRSEAYLAEAQRLSKTGSFGWNVATGEIFWSAETYCILGYDPTVKPTLEVVFNRVHPDDLGLVRRTVEQASRDGESLDFEHRLLMPDGTVRHVHTVANPVRDSTGEIELVGAVIDITEKKNSELALHETAEALRASEHLARGQAEALAGTLATLSRESEPEKLLEHMLEMIGRQLGAHSVGVWELNPSTGRVHSLANCEDGRLSLATPEQIQASPQIGLTTQYHPIWTEFFRTGAHCVNGDIQADSVRVRIAEIPDSPWYDWQSDVVTNSQAVARQLYARGFAATLSVPTFVAGRVNGAISIRFQQQRTFRPEQIELTRALAQQAMLAIQLMRLSRQSREAAVMAERNRVARDIHDTLAQGFTGVIVQLEAAADATTSGLAKEAEAHVKRAMDLARESLKEARRSVFALRPQALEQGNLCRALEALIRKMTDGTATRATFRVSGDPRRLPGDWEDNLLRIGQELLTNALRHARPGSTVTELAFADSTVRLDFRDDGLGFDPAVHHDGFGLRGIRERVDGMGGELTIDSALGIGTAVAIVLPHAQADTVWQA
jgi:PAS domain S-box-containing protein